MIGESTVELRRVFATKVNDKGVDLKDKTEADRIGDEIIAIMETYDKQEAEQGYVYTPGGLEHMGDVWKLLRSWRDRLKA